MIVALSAYLSIIQQCSYCVSLTAFSFISDMKVICWKWTWHASTASFRLHQVSLGANAMCVPSNGHFGDVNQLRVAGRESVLGGAELTCQSWQVNTASVTLSWHQLTPLMKLKAHSRNTYVKLPAWLIKKKKSLSLSFTLCFTSLSLRPSSCVVIQSYFTLSPTVTFSGWSDHDRCLLATSTGFTFTLHLAEAIWCCL